MMRSFFSNFNVRLMIIHFIAFCLFIWAFETLAFLHDYYFLFSVQFDAYRTIFPERFKADIEFIIQAGNIGLLVGYVISWAVSNKGKWHWINSVTIFLLAFLLKNFLLSSVLDKIFLTPGGPFKISAIWSHILLSAGLAGAGLILFFSKRAIRYIDSANNVHKKENVRHKKHIAGDASKAK